MDILELEKGFYRKTDLDTCRNREGATLIPRLNEPDNSWLTRFPPGDLKIGQKFKLLKTQKKNVFKIFETKDNLFLEFYKDRIEIKSE